MVDGQHSVHASLERRRLSKESGGKTEVLTAHEVPKLTAMDTVRDAAGFGLERWGYNLWVGVRVTVSDESDNKFDTRTPIV